MSGKVPLVLLVVCAGSYAEVEADASRGAAILNEKGCTGCHAVGSSGSTVRASTLTRSLNREYTPAGFTATLWNHAPQMFAAIRKEKGSLPQLSESEAADLFAYFASLRYFEPMGEASRGSRLIHQKKCAQCHFLGGPGQLVEKWRSLGDPVELASRMWNHQPQMQAEMAKRGIKQPAMTAQDLTDIVVYARGLPRTEASPVMVQLPTLEGADKLLEEYGCTGCHKGDMAFSRIVTDTSMTDIAVAMWNHGLKMTSAQRTIPSEEMRKIVTWVWMRQLVEPGGNASRGERFAKSKKCLDCHSGGGAGPAFASLPQNYSVVQATSALWKHGPTMLAAMQQKGFQWPRFTAENIEDLLAYVRSAKTK